MFALERETLIFSVYSLAFIFLLLSEGSYLQMCSLFELL